MTSLYPPEWTEEQILEQYWIERFATQYGVGPLRDAVRQSREPLSYPKSAEILRKYADLGRNVLDMMKTDSPQDYELHMNTMRKMLFDENGETKSE